jgi:hypothetical protein
MGRPTEEEIALARRNAEAAIREFEAGDDTYRVDYINDMRVLLHALREREALRDVVAAHYESAEIGNGEPMRDALDNLAAFDRGDESEGGHG